MTGSRRERIGAAYLEVYADPPGQSAAGEWLLERLVGRPHPLVLDVGCGSGMPTARQLIDGGCEVVGVDTSAILLESARNAVPDAIFIERDLFDLDGLHPPQQRFDGVVSFFSMLMFTHAEIELALDDIRHVLAPDGLFVLGMVRGEAAGVKHEGRTAPVTMYSDEQLRLLLQLHGFAVQELRVHEVEATSDAPERTRQYALCRVS